MNDPSTPEDLTSAWLAQALGRPVNGFEVERFGEGAGVIGQVTRVHLDCDEPPRSIIAKFPSPAAENRAVAATYDMYGREVRFYQNIASRVQMRTPACYYAAHDPATQDFVLLLEDLQGYRIGDQVAGCSADEARAVVRALAKFHASAWDPGDELDLPSHNNPAQRDGMVAGFQAGWPVIMERFSHLVPDAALVAEKRMPELTGALLTEMCTPPVSICHADVRLDNVFFGDEEIFFVDWQSVCTSAPEQDLAYFVTQSVHPEVIPHQELLDLYYETLTGLGVTYERTRFERRYKVAALYLLDYAVVIAGTLDLANERGTQLAETLLGGSMRSLEAMGAFELLK